MSDLGALEIPIVDTELLRLALRHRSACQNGVTDSYERLEFFGDSVLGFVIAQYLYEQFPLWDQGMLSKAKATIVQETPLAEAALRLGLDAYVEISPTEESSGARQRPSLLADTFEAVVAAVYLDQGLQIARWFVLEHLHPIIARVCRGEVGTDDYKSRLQEIAQARWRQTPTYRLVSERGFAHEKLFVMEVILEGEVMGSGVGRSKKEAEQLAAREALELIERVESNKSERIPHGE
jgi:ribonuclease-3